MKKYFYIEDEKQLGPFTIEELKAFNIQKITPIWHEKLTDWTTAGELKELAELFEEKSLIGDVINQEKEVTKSLVPQPISPQQQNPNQRQHMRGKYPPKTWLVESILVTLFCCLPFGIAGIVFASKVESLFYMGDVEGAERASREAAKWTKIGFWIAAGIGILYFVAFLIQLLFIGGSMISIFNNME